MITEETRTHRDAVSEVFDELDSFLKEKSAEYSAKLNAPYSGGEPTEEELQERASAGYLSIAYTSMHIFTQAQAAKYLKETNRILSRYVHELKTMLNED